MIRRLRRLTPQGGRSLAKARYAFCAAKGGLSNPHDRIRGFEFFFTANKKSPMKGLLLLVAEREGFEPSKGF